MSARSVSGRISEGTQAIASPSGGTNQEDDDLRIVAVGVTILALGALAVVAAASCSDGPNRATDSNDTRGCGCNLL